MQEEEKILCQTHHSSGTGKNEPASEQACQEADGCLKLRNQNGEAKAEATAMCFQLLMRREKEHGHTKHPSTPAETLSTGVNRIWMKSVFRTR